jgi:hypothetical protein
MRYIVAARIIPGKEQALKAALDDGSFGPGFPFGDLGDNLRACRVDDDGVLRWTETCYCREYSSVALVMELEYFEPFLHAIEIADARDPRYCKGYPACNDCLCTKTIRHAGVPLDEYLQRFASANQSDAIIPTRWTGWRGKVQTEEEKQRNEHRLQPQ